MDKELLQGIKFTKKFFKFTEDKVKETDINANRQLFLG